MVDKFIDELVIFLEDVYSDGYYLLEESLKRGYVEDKVLTMSRDSSAFHGMISRYIVDKYIEELANGEG